ncbi:MarR family transcriptional regulator [Cognatishimia sp. SS12]|nr:MarR family transcriptional regulator [Cognatishimia sp. SS12]
MKHWAPRVPLNETLPARLLRARDALMQFYRPLFKNAGVTEAQWRILRSLYEETSVEPQVLSKRAFMQPPNVSRVLRELVDLGLAKRLVAKRDKRRAPVALTPKGREVCAEIGQKIEEKATLLAAETDQDVIQELHRLLKIVIEFPDQHRALLDTAESDKNAD